MRRDEVRDALDAMASAVPSPEVDASRAIARGRRRMRQGRLALGGVVALLATIVVAAGAIARTADDGSPRVASVPTTADVIDVAPESTTTTTTTTPAQAQPIPIPLAFVSATEGWLCSKPMQYTADAGANWSNVDISASPIACAAIPGGDAWVLVPTTDPRHQRLVHLSRDGREDFSFPDLPSGYTVDELSFADSQNGFAHAGTPAGDRAGLLTRDGGRTWEIGGNNAGVPRFGSPTDGWAPVGGAELAHVAAGDGGFSWQDVKVPAPEPATTGVINVRPVTVDGDLVVAQGLNPDGHQADVFIDVSTDGGHTWSMRSGPPGLTVPSDRVTPFSATDADHWQLGSSSQLFTTDDGGATWTTTAEFAGISQITAVDFVTPDVGFVSATGIGDAANGTVVLQTNDGGNTWRTAAIQAPPMDGEGPINFPGGIFGCPSHPLATPPAGNPPTGLIDAAVKNIETTSGWTPEGKPLAYRVGTIPPENETYAGIFKFQIPSCGPETVAVSWVVELYGAPGSGGGGSTPQAQVVLAYSPDGWHVYGRYH